MEAVKATEPVTPDIPDEIALLNGDIAELDVRIQNSRSAFDKAQETLNGHSEELEKLDSDEQEKLLLLGELEADKKSPRPAREALDSIRGRRLLLTKKVTDLNADQEGRRASLTDSMDKRSDLVKKRDQAVAQWLRAEYLKKEQALKDAAHAALREWCVQLIASNAGFPMLHSQQWLRAHFFRGLEAQMHAEGLALRAKLIAQVENTGEQE